MDVEPPLELLAWVSAELGPTRAWARLDAGRGSTMVFGLVDAGDRRWIVKQYRSARGCMQEHAALTRWLAGRAELGGARVPRVRAHHVELAALILEHLPGEPVDEFAGDADVQRAAGRFLAALHGLAIPDDDPLPVGEALERRTRAWLRRGDLEPELAAFVEAHGPRSDLFEGVRRVPCHRDFAPRNWLWDGARLAVFDLEHARLDLALADLVKLWVDVWAERPDAGSAFLAGYGRVLAEREREQLRALVVLHGAASLVWGRRRGNPDHVAEGRRALAVWATPPPREPL